MKVDENENEISMVGAKLREDPTNLAHARAYWGALGPRRSGRHILEAFGPAARKGVEGAEEFARAYRELFDESGEGPRSAYVDRDLLAALQAATSKVAGASRDEIQWVINSIENRTFEND